MSRLPLSLEARRRYRYYREHLIWDCASQTNPRTGRIRAHEQGKSMMYVATSGPVIAWASRKAKEMVAEDLRIARMNGWRLKRMPRREWAQCPY